MWVFFFLDEALICLAYAAVVFERALLPSETLANVMWLMPPYLL